MQQSQMVAGSGHQRLLIVDDEMIVRRALLAILQEKYHCEPAANAEEALALLNQRDYQLVLSDITMPGLDGLELLSAVKAAKPTTAVIMISGLGTIESAIEALRRGAFDYLTKPFEVQVVELAIERALKHQALIEANLKYERDLEELVETRTQQLNRMFENLYLNYRATLQALASALEARDAETRGHSRRVVAYCLRLGRQVGLSDTELMALEHGALLHDIGKIGTPDAILLKPGALSSEEWQVMRRHIDHGAEILRGISFLEDATPVVLQHHEKWDGSGYPRGLKGAEISINARIFALADAIDAITSDRPYHRAESFEAAAGEIARCAGRHFDPRVVRAFFEISLDEWRQLRETATEEENRLGEVQRRVFRSLILA
jgi:putative nucleotidyltransferase with HDIG domain